MADPLVGRLLLALDQGPAAVLITDLAGRIEYVNQRFTTITGYTADEAIGKTPALLKSGETPLETYRDLWGTIKAGRQWRGEIRNRRKGGELFVNAVTITPLRDQSGAVTNYLGVQEDVTEQRRAEQAVRERDELERQLRQAQKMEALGQLAGGVAHDFNNILTAITGYAELLRTGLPGGEMAEEIDEILRAARRAAALTRQLLAFSRKQLLQSVPLDPNEIVRNLEPMLRRLIGEHIVIDGVLEADALVLADPGQLEQVLMNLVVNARDAMPQGGRITIATHEVELNETDAALHGPGLSPGPYVVIAVTDTGAGMTPDVRQRIFEPFFTTKAAGKGSGLGLAMVYGIVKQSGGTVTVYSEPGTGSTFRVYLPRAAAVLPARSPAAVAQAASLRGSETILVIEDDEAVRALAAAILERHGYGVLSARTGEEGIAAASRLGGPIHLMITDVVLTGLHGPEVARRIRLHTPGVRVLFMSGYAGAAGGQEDALSAADPFLEKPFTAEMLARKVREVLDAP